MRLSKAVKVWPIGSRVYYDSELIGRVIGYVADRGAVDRLTSNVRLVIHHNGREHRADPDGVMIDHEANPHKWIPGNNPKLEKRKE